MMHLSSFNICSCLHFKIPSTCTTRQFNMLGFRATLAAFCSYLLPEFRFQFGRRSKAVAVTGVKFPFSVVMVL